MIKSIVIHCADTPANMDIGVEEIKRWHLDRGWRDVGYHYVIRRNGEVEQGREEHVPGAHVAGHNEGSIGVCLVGGKPDANFTKEQWKALEALVEYLTRKYPKAAVMGHRDLDSGKACPCFDAKAWWNN